MLSKVGISTGYYPNYETLPHYEHMAIDATSASPYANRIYMAYSEFYDYYFSNGVAPIKMMRSVNGTWYVPINISGNRTGTFSRGVKLATDTYGNVFALWAIYDEDAPSPEDALGFNHSTDGGVTWGNPRRAVEISGIWGRWSHKNPEQQLIEVNSFPSLAIDRSGGPYRGRVYAAWADNRNGDPDIYFATLNQNYSTDEGASWTGLKRVNNDQLGNGKDQWMPSISVSDQGVISIVFYDSRNDPNNQLTEVWLAQSINGGNSFTNYKISDVAFTPYPVFSSAYMGDYNTGVTTSQGYTVPCWADNRTNHYQAYIERFVAPPQNVQVAATPPDQYGYRYPKITWTANSEGNLSGYELSRRKIGSMNCTNQDWTVLTSSIGPSSTEYTDWSIGTAIPGGDCTAEYRLRAKDIAGGFSDYSVIVAINYASWFWKPDGGDAGNIQKPKFFAFHAAYPNPFNPSTMIKYDMPEPGKVSLIVYDLLGRKVAELVNQEKAAGYYSITWNAGDVASGVYITRFVATDANGYPKYSKINKLVLMK